MHRFRRTEATQVPTESQDDTQEVEAWRSRVQALKGPQNIRGVLTLVCDEEGLTPASMAVRPYAERSDVALAVVRSTVAAEPRYDGNDGIARGRAEILSYLAFHQE